MESCVIACGGSRQLYSCSLIQMHLATREENDREDMNDQLENAGLEVRVCRNTRDARNTAELLLFQLQAQGMSDRYQSFMDEKAKEHEEHRRVRAQRAKSPAVPSRNSRASPRALP